MSPVARAATVLSLLLAVTVSTTSALTGPGRIDRPADVGDLAHAVRNPQPTAPTTTVPTPTTTTSTIPAPTTTVAPRPTAIVSLGDSFISGEAGRWAGNSDNDAAGSDGTDRAYVAPGPADAALVYGNSGANECHRSDVAPIHSTGIPVDIALNIACSNAETQHIIDTEFKGEAPQSEQLEQLARDYDIQMVVLSIGGNDLGFADMVIACSSNYLNDEGTCNAAQQAQIDLDMPAAMAGVEASIAEVRAAMTAAGSTPADYRLVLVSYPSPLPRASLFRFPEAGPSRTEDGRCPMWDEDANWARDSLTPEISDNLRVVANENGTEFIDLSDALDGREACSLATDRPAVGGAPNSITSEWTRWFELAPQGEYAENVHPNAYGQQAYGKCLDLVWNAAADGEWTCTNTPGEGPSSMVLTTL